MVFLVVMYGHVRAGQYRGRTPKNWYFLTVVLEKTLESPLGSKEIKPMNLKGNQPWILFGRTVAEAPILWHPMQTSDSLEKTLMLGNIEDRRWRWWKRMRWLDDITNTMDMNLGKLQKMRDREPGVWHFIGSQRIGNDWNTEQQQQDKISSNKETQDLQAFFTNRISHFYLGNTLAILCFKFLW